MTDDTLHERAMGAVLEADEILRRHGPATFVNIMVAIAKEDLERGRYTLVADNFKRAEEEVRSTGSRVALNSLIHGYNSVIAICSKIPPGVNMVNDFEIVRYMNRRDQLQIYVHSLDQRK